MLRLNPSNLTRFQHGVIQRLFLLISLLTLTSVRAQTSIDIGPSTTVPGTTSFKNNGVLITRNSQGIPANGFRWSRRGQNFHVSLNLSPGTYDIHLGFIESILCRRSARVFHIYVNGQLEKESFDIFASASACRKAHVTTISRVTVSPIKVQPIQIRFVAVTNQASISYIRVSKSANACIPVTRTVNILEQHLAHAVPGSYPPLVDTDGNKFESTLIDGRNSHTHFSYSGGSGKIISYEWRLVESGTIISRKAFFRYKFPMGATRIRLSVMDNACTQDSAETTVTVTGVNQPGRYCYLYPHTAFLQPGALLRNRSPVAAFLSNSLNTAFPALPITKFKFMARCVFFINFPKAKKSKFSIFTAGSGRARVYEGTDLILDSKSRSTSNPKNIPKGMVAFEIIYARTNAMKKATVQLKVDGMVPSQVSHDRSQVLPIINDINPKSGIVSGGTNVRISGYGLYHPLKVWFGTKSVTVDRPISDKQAIASSPVMLRGGSVQLRVQTGTGPRSNSLPYQYGGATTCDNIAFTNAKLSMASNRNVPLNQPTSAALGNDNKLYFGLRSGIIQVVTYDYISLRVTATCKSNTLRDSRYKRSGGKPSIRTILGIAFDPRDKVPRPYVGVSSLFWGIFKYISPSNKLAWSNGAVERFRPASAATRARNPGQCLEYDRNIVRNLPVSDGDHAINELVFTDFGDLLIAVGGNTNMGLPSYKFGGRWENIFSGAVLIARLSRGSKFNGNIPYTTPQNMEIAKPRAGYTDVQTYATGLRNLFSLTMARSGRIYGVDMGPNCKFGNASTSCQQYKQTSNPFVDKVNGVPGTIVDRKKQGVCRYGPGRGDKLVEIKNGKFYGHPNIQRSLLANNFGECAWIDPITGRKPGGGPPPRSYQHRLSYFPSAKTGVREYKSNLFCGKLRGNLIMSKAIGQGTYRLIVNKNGQVQGSPFTFAGPSGIRVIENMHGDLFFPKYYGQGVNVLKAKVPRRTGLFIANALPFRHGRRGGTPITIGGWGFKQGATASVGGKVCKIVNIQARQIICTVPAWSGGSRLVAVIVKVGGQQSTLDEAVRYMSV